ncbi:MAG: beta-xylosidase [Pedobacter sp.]|nr:MAG: beta-xylosidase [Pedobacter sp.]
MNKLKITLLCFTMLLQFVRANAQSAKYSAYLFAYFTGNDKSEESIRFALSKDGFVYKALNNNRPIVNSATISSTGGVRDPHILRGVDRKSFYMVVTDMVSAKGWNSNRAMVLLKSNDLLNWKSSVINIQKRYNGHGQLNRVWAPQTIYDQQVGKYVVYWSMQHGNGPDIIYWAYANKEFTDLETEPVQLFVHPDGHSCIDGDIIYEKGKYHLFFKTEGKDLGIRVAVSTNLKEGYKLQAGSVQQTSDPVEGSGVFKLNDGKGYILMYDLYTKGNYQFTISENLSKFKVVDNSIKMDFHPRHGTVLPITAEEAIALQKKWYSPDDFIRSAQNPDIKINNVVVDTAAGSIFYPVKNANALKSFDPGFVFFPGIQVSPKPPYNLTKGTVKLKVSVHGHDAKYYQVSAAADLNPVLDGYYADPEILYSNKTGKYHIYPTSDGYIGWSGNYFKTFSSENLAHWKDDGVIIDLPKDVQWANRNAWAPTIAEKKIDGEHKYYFYFTAAQKIGVAVANHPSGPYKDSGKPLISGHPKNIKEGQEIDPDVFTDPKTGRSYLYWGNGYMAVAPLNENMISIDTTAIKIITPDKTYREGTEVFFRNGKYYFMWSENDTRDANYGVRYGTSDSPTGNITIPANNLVLRKNEKLGIYATGHNSVIQVPGKDEWYIVYHRFSHPNGIKLGEAAGFNREVCIDKLEFDANGAIIPVVPTLKGIRVTSGK